MQLGALTQNMVCLDGDVLSGHMMPASGIIKLPPPTSAQVTPAGATTPRP